MATRRNPSFFKLLVGDHFCDKLKIPQAFLRHFDGNVPEQCQLRIRTQTWPVDIEMVDHKFYFQNGWKEFVHENGLKGREFLVFFYDGISEFYVHIYGKNTCKKQFAEVTRHYVDTSVETLDDFPPSSRRAVEKSSLPSHQPHKKDSTSWSDKKPGITRKYGFPTEQFVGGTSSSKMGGSWEVHTDDDDDDQEEETGEDETEAHSEDEDEEEEEDDDDKEEESGEDETEADSEDEDEEEEEESDGDASDDSIEILDEFPQCSKAKTMRKSSGHHKRKTNSSKAKLQSSITGASTGELTARYRASDFISKSDKPSCSIAMSPTYVHAAWVHFPKVFAIRHLKTHCSRITLRINKRSWCIDLYRVKKVVRLQTGWTEFVHANNLREGDVCVLVLIDSIRYIFDVTIFRATEAANCTLPGSRHTTPRVNPSQKKEKRKLDEAHRI